MADRQRKALRNVRMKIYSDLDPSVLVNMQCLTRSSREHIRAVLNTRGPSEASSLLLDTIVRHQGWWNELLGTLREECDQSEIAEILEAEYRRLGGPSTSSSTSSLSAASGGRVVTGEDEVDDVAAGIQQMKFRERPQGNLNADVDHSDSSEDIFVPEQGPAPTRDPRRTGAKQYDFMIMHQKTNEGFQLLSEFQDELERRFPDQTIRPHLLGVPKLKDADQGIKESTIIFILISTVPCKEFEFLTTLPFEHSYNCNKTKIIPVFETPPLKDEAPTWLNTHEGFSIEMFRGGFWDQRIWDTLRSTESSQPASGGQPMSVAGGAVAGN